MEALCFIASILDFDCVYCGRLVLVLIELEFCFGLEESAGETFAVLKQVVLYCFSVVLNLNLVLDFCFRLGFFM